MRTPPFFGGGRWGKQVGGGHKGGKTLGGIIESRERLSGFIVYAPMLIVKKRMLSFNEL